MVKLLTFCILLAPVDRAKAIEKPEEVESAYCTVALQGDSDVPQNAEHEVDFHYLCFVKSSKSGHICDLDGDRKGPVDHGAIGSGLTVAPMGLKTLLSFVLCFHHFIIVGSTPLQTTPLQIFGVNNTTSDSLLNNASVTAPRLPHGIQLTIDHNVNKKLVALDIYLIVGRAMLQLGRLGWDDKPVSLQGYRISLTGYDVEIDIKNSQKPEDPLQLKTSYIVTGLWEMMVRISLDDLYCETVVTLKQHYREIGTLTITTKQPTVEAAANDTNADASLLSAPAILGDADPALRQAAPVNLTAGPGYPAGRVFDPTDRFSSIFYTYTRTQIKSKDVFMAIIGLLADAAQYPPPTPVQEIYQYSPSNKCRVRLTSLVGLDYGFAARGLGLIITEIMLPLRKFGDMRFQLEYRGSRVGDGVINAINPTPVVAAEKK